MKIFAIFLSLLTFSGFTLASDATHNCFSNKSVGYYIYLLEEIANEKNTPVLLLNKKDEVVGLLSVEPRRSANYPYKAHKVNVLQLTLCSSLEVSSFYYTESEDSNLLSWDKSEKVEMTQDEGMIILSSSLEGKIQEASKYKLQFKVYYGDTEPDESESTNPDFIEHWGVPKASGELYYFLPKNWVWTSLEIL